MNESSDLKSGKWEIQLRKGSLDLVMLSILWNKKRYGLEILRELENRAGFTVTEGTLYPLLSRLKRDGLLATEWVEGESGHPRKYYWLTPAGRRSGRELARRWRVFSSQLADLIAPLESEEASK